MNPVQLAQLLGHSGLRMIEQVYAHLNEDDGYDAVLRMLTGDRQGAWRPARCLRQSRSVNAISLEGSRRRAYEVLLKRRDGILAQQYYSALVVLESDALPDRHAMVAHQLRELVNSLWTIVDDIEPAPQGRTVENVAAAMRDQLPGWKKCLAVTDWSAAVDWREACKAVSVQTALNRVHEIMAALDRPHADRDRLTRAVVASDPSLVKAPAAVYASFVKAMWRVRGYFNDVSHRNIHPTDEEFAQQVNRLDLLIDGFFPSVVEADFDALDADIDEVERGR